MWEKEEFVQLVCSLKNESNMKFQIDACMVSGINEQKASFESTKRWRRVDEEGNKLLRLMWRNSCHNNILSCWIIKDGFVISSTFSLISAN